MKQQYFVSVIWSVVVAGTLVLGSHTAWAQSFAPDAEKSSCPRSPQTEKEENACEVLIEKYPNDPDLYFNIGNYFGSKRHDKDAARAWYKKGIEANNNYYRSYIVSALLADWDGNPGKAIADLNEAIRLNPKDAFAYINRGNVWNALAYNNRDDVWKEGDYDKAIADYNEAIRLDPTESLAHNHRGTVWRHKGDYAKAIADYNEAIRLNPKDASAYNNRGSAWNALAHNNRDNVWKEGDYDRAIADYNEAIKLDPKYAASYSNRGNAWRDKGDYDKAIADYNEAIKLDPKYAFAYNNRGNAWKDKGDYDKAIADYSDAIKLDPKYAFAYYNRGNVWKDKGDYDKAIVDFEEAVRLNPNYANAKENLQLSLNKRQREEVRRASADKQWQPSGQQAASGSASTGKRVALVIGNSKYKSVIQLDNPSRDAELFAKTLRDVGFDEVTTRMNLSRAEMMAALKNFEKIAADADWAAIYFAGHGMEIGGVNYMVPIDAQITDQNIVSTQTVNLEYLLNSVEVAKKLRLVILDACRNNPFVQQVRVASASRAIGGAGSSSIGNGLARIEPEPGTLVVYAAKHGEFALDGDGKNSPFVEALVRRIEQKPPIEVRRLFDFVRKDVFVVTKKEQQPFAYGSLEPGEDFYFAK